MHYHQDEYVRDHLFEPEILSRKDSLHIQREKYNRCRLARRKFKRKINKNSVRKRLQAHNSKSQIRTICENDENDEDDEDDFERQIPSPVDQEVERSYYVSNDQTLFKCV